MLATEMYKVNNNFSPTHINEIFEMRNEDPYILRKTRSVFPPFSNSLSHLGLKVWDILPNIYNNMDGLEKLKMAIKKWKAENRPWRICKKCIANVGFIWKIMVELFISQILITFLETDF